MIRGWMSGHCWMVYHLLTHLPYTLQDSWGENTTVIYQYINHTTTVETSQTNATTVEKGSIGDTRCRIVGRKTYHRKRSWQEQKTSTLWTITHIADRWVETSTERQSKHFRLKKNCKERHQFKSLMWKETTVRLSGKSWTLTLCLRVCILRGECRC